MFLTRRCTLIVTPWSSLNKVMDPMSSYLTRMEVLHFTILKNGWFHFHDWHFFVMHFLNSAKAMDIMCSHLIRIIDPLHSFTHTSCMCCVVWIFPAIVLCFCSICTCELCSLKPSKKHMFLARVCALRHGNVIQGCSMDGSDHHLHASLFRSTCHDDMYARVRN